MNRKPIFYTLTIIIFSVFAATYVVAHGGMPDFITIDKAQAKKPPVVFPHEEHSEDFDCVTCHHTITKKEEAKSCFECHGKDPNAPDPSVSSATKNPFHILCRGCHKEKGEGPTKCLDCHKSE